MNFPVFSEVNPEFGPDRVNSTGTAKPMGSFGGRPSSSGGPNTVGGISGQQHPPPSAHDSHGIQQKTGPGRYSVSSGAQLGNAGLNGGGGGSQISSQGVPLGINPQGWNANSQNRGKK